MEGGDLGKENGDRPPTIFGLKVAVLTADLVHPKMLAWAPPMGPNVFIKYRTDKHLSIRNES